MKAIQAALRFNELLGRAFKYYSSVLLIFL
jgi:hypothetical protein